MPPTTRLEAAHLTILWAYKLALPDFFYAVQL
jgi:hypothetical protein